MAKIGHICTSRLMYKLLYDKLVLLYEVGYDIDIISAEDGVENNIFNEIGINQKYIDMKREISILSDIKSIIEMVKFLKKEQFIFDFSSLSVKYICPDWCLL